MQTSHPLSGITVVSIEHAIAAPFCTRHLADLGARVIKVERPGEGDFARAYDNRARGMASHFVWVNRSKESLALDLKNSEELEALHHLLESADVFVQNLAPGAADRMGLNFDTLSKRNAGLIVCDISGYGSNGPYRGKKAYDLLIQSEAGFLSVTGTEGGPVKAGCSIADISAGMYAYSSILAALIQRGKSGKGCRIDVSMLECMAEWMGFPLYYALDGAPPPIPSGASHASIFPYGPFAAGDKRTVMLGIQNEREWAKFCEQVLEQPELRNDDRFDTNSKRSAARAELTEIILQAFAPLTAQEVIARLEKADIANAEVRNMQQVWDHPQLRARGRWMEIDTPVGPMPALMPPGLPDGVAPYIGPVPRVGQHNEAILGELKAPA
ncbi:L-carnitine dehydratase/bile acid-inducible protein F (plasmid) [Rhizobium leguminosarum bv. trifolii WSM2304]|uniref:L-carnitine dehydratase/bile acid-inducible protein F n=1 Tax=Rhizobium leguminosarum bv. trifolii (strain WSM2304) TaxID=395492 RepID=A0ABF7QYX5_RHILW|nr:CaiB/BaiF CoA-transferase family protein [Rhizobium leguminosarum]ACI59508.1 L-carnitine dehydratase/bile acid-inducible protein F [Rhizobium leguminosarum bv. trifolii WSM2304]